MVVEGCLSDGRPMSSSVPRGSVLGPLLFVIDINDIDENVRGMISKFADDTKIGRVVNSEGGQSLQEDIDGLVRWAEQWQMVFNSDKCKVMYFGRRNKMREYLMNGKVVEARNLTTFKKYLDEHLKYHNIQGYGTSAGKWDECAFRGRYCWSRLDGLKDLFWHCMTLSYDSEFLRGIWTNT